MAWLTKSVNFTATIESNIGNWNKKSSGPKRAKNTCCFVREEVSFPWVYKISSEGSFFLFFFFSFDLEGAKYGFPVFLREFQRKGKRGEPRRTPCNPTNQVDFFSKAATRKN